MDKLEELLSRMEKSIGWQVIKNELLDMKTELIKEVLDHTETKNDFKYSLTYVQKKQIKAINHLLNLPNAIKEKYVGKMTDEELLKKNLDRRDIEDIDYTGLI